MAPSRLSCIERLWPLFCNAMHRLRWTTRNDISVVHSETGELCLLRRLRANSQYLTPLGKRSLSHLTDSGISVRPRWRDYDLDGLLLGMRLYVSHAGNFSPDARYASLVSSRMGRYQSQLPDWPSFFDSAFRYCTRNKLRLLVVPKTAPSEIVYDLATIAELPLISCSLAESGDTDSCTLEQWIVTLLERDDFVDASQKQLLVSGELDASDDRFQDLPIQDRASIALSDTTFALSVRSGGNIYRLLQHRLESEEFPPASTFIAIRDKDHSKRKLNRATAERKLLAHGAVGWYITDADRTSLSTSAYPSLRCKKSDPRTDVPYLQQACGPLTLHWQNMPDHHWTFLSHCTRGQSGPKPLESDEAYHRRTWIGSSEARSPFLSLVSILESCRLYGTAEITRTDNRCVCFSQVPLAELLSRRTFRSHLGRWDWEPYGICIRLDALEQIGCRRVIYGSENDFLELDERDRPYFQPLGKSTSRSSHSWEQEREWRLLGDLDLARIPKDSLFVFTKSRAEALALSRCCSWQVFWTSQR